MTHKIELKILEAIKSNRNPTDSFVSDEKRILEKLVRNGFISKSEINKNMRGGIEIKVNRDYDNISYTLTPEGKQRLEQLKQENK